MIGTVLRIRYELTQLLSEGPIFATYAARDQLQQRDVSVRVLKPPFAQEAAFVEALKGAIVRNGKLSHPGVESLFEVDEHEGIPFVVGELSRGTLMSERIRKLAPFSVPVAVAAVLSLCEGLKAVHDAGLVHGDVSATNAIAQQDGAIRLQLTGVWKSYGASATAGMAVLPSMAPYLAPEVGGGAMPSPASDVYSAGVLLFELLTGRLPYQADTPVGMAMKHATNATPSVRTLNTSVPAVLDEMVRKAMAKDPADRYPNAGAFLSDLRMLQDALRFGRPLAWPLTADAPPAESEPPRVAPKMSAVRQEAKERREQEPGDVPGWMLWSAGLLGAVALVLLGVWITFNLNKPRLVQVPNIKNMSLAEARSVLEGLNLGVRVVGNETSEDVEKDHILRIQPDAAQPIKEGAQVLAWVSSGSRFVAVPDLRGLPLDRAKTVLATVGLQPGARIDEVPTNEVRPGFVVSQNPEPRRQVERFTTVRIGVSIASGRRTARLNRGRGTPTIYTMRVRMQGIPEAVTVRVDATDSRGTQTVYEARHEPDSTAEVTTQGYGEEILFKIFYNDRLVKEVRETPPPLRRSEEDALR